MSDAVVEESDILIVGSGIAGAGVAAALVQNSGSEKYGSLKKITVLEREGQPGYHSTGRSAAIWIESYGNDCIRDLNSRSHRFLVDPAGVKGGSVLSRRGFLVAASSNDSEELDSLLASSKAIDEISPESASRLVPVWRTENYDRFGYEANASDIDVDRLHKGFIGVACTAGTRLVTSGEVLSVERADGLWQVETNAGKYCAKLLVNAAGAWADSVALMVGARPQSLVAKRRSAAIVELVGKPEVSQWPLFAEIQETWYAKPEGGKLMVSPADEEPIDACDAWVDDEVLAGGIDRFESVITDSVKRVSHSWAGLRTFAPDATPVVGFDPAVDDFFWLAGHGGYGIQTSPALSEFAASLILGKPVNLSLLNQMNPGRSYA